MRVITLLNEKGGVGKTTLSTHIAAGLAIRGHRVALVDADPQGHATFMMGADKAPGLYDLLVREAPYRDVMRVVQPEQYSNEPDTITGSLFLIPANVEVRTIPMNTSNVMVAQERLRELEGTIDVVVIDTSPTPSLLHAMIYLASDSIIYPTKLELLSFDGLLESLKHRQMIQGQRQQMGMAPLEVMGIVPVMYRSKTVVHNHNLEALKERFGTSVWPAIQQRTIWTEAANERQLVFTYQPESAASKDAWDLVKRIEGAMAQWSEKAG